MICLLQGIETEDFWSYLGGEPEEEPPVSVWCVYICTYVKLKRVLCECVLYGSYI